jgi:hypothetical protein
MTLVEYVVSIINSLLNRISSPIVIFETRVLGILEAASVQFLFTSSVAAIN